MTTCHDAGAEPHLAQIRALYTALAEEPHRDFGWGKGKENARALGYAPEWLDALPDAVWESAAAVGNPFAVAAIGAGQTVVDLGCGAGADACVAALLVGPRGRVVGVDCTPAMVAKARASAALAGLSQVEMYESDMARLPLPDGCADVVISNGAINLVADKTRVLAEACRVLRPGGRLQIADMVKDPAVEQSTCCSSADSWADCVSGTLDPDAFVALLRAAGFSGVRLVGFTGYRTAAHTVGALFEATRPD
ncbi:MAG: methyltransferase domain-containing protein [Gammaproteobacteria bacterium]|nr:methyltransferase domain-containing protein [Gammaproteobacteria bacterium]